MRRNSELEKNMEVSVCRPWFFWTFCCNCGMEFRRERGYKMFTGPYYNGFGIWRYLCSQCSPDINAACRVFASEPWKPPRPSPPKPIRPKN